MTRSPIALLTGIDSPVTIDSSIVARPSITMPSTGTRSPGRTLSPSPTSIAEMSISRSLPSSRIFLAVFGARSSSARIAPLVVCARSELQHLTEQHQDSDDRRRLEIDRHRAVHAAEGRREEPGRNRRDHAVEPGDAGPHGNQREHVEIAV